MTECNRTSNPVYKTARDCLDTLERECARHDYMGWCAKVEAMKKRRDKQQFCSACRRWKFPEERCNHFMRAQEVA